MYANPDVVYNLKGVDGQQFAELLKINLGNKTYETGFDVIDSGGVTVSTVKLYRKYLLDKVSERYEKYLQGPTLIWDQIKNPDTMKLRFLPVDLAIKLKKKVYSESKPPGVSGRPILSIYDMYPYFMNKEQWRHCWFLPILCKLSQI